MLLATPKSFYDKKQLELAAKTAIKSEGVKKKLKFNKNIKKLKISHFDLIIKI